MHVERSDVSTGSILFPRVPLMSFDFVAPRLWSAQIPERLTDRFGIQLNNAPAVGALEAAGVGGGRGPPDVPTATTGTGRVGRAANITRYLQAFVHPSYLPDPSRATMQALAPVGRGVLDMYLACWLASMRCGRPEDEQPNDHDEAHDDHRHRAVEARPEDTLWLREHIFSERTLAAVCENYWQFSDLILTDARVRSPRRIALTRSLPDGATADCARALVAALALDRGLPAVMEFIADHVAPPAMRAATAIS